MLSKLTFRAGGAESGPGIGPKHRGIAGSITERTDTEGYCRLAGVMNNINHDDFSTQIVISKFLVIDFHRFSSIFAKFAKFDDNFITETWFFYMESKNCCKQWQHHRMMLASVPNVPQTEFRETLALFRGLVPKIANFVKIADNRFSRFSSIFDEFRWFENIC